MNRSERLLTFKGASFLSLITGAVAYTNYRERIKKEFLRSEGHYRFSHLVENVTPWQNMYFTWFRMPEPEFEVYHRFRPYYILGQLDQSKEVLIPQKFRGQEGYMVINPMYCYEGGKLSFKDIFAGNDFVKIERAALIVNRGWIPAELKDKRTRPNESNTRKLVKMKGVFRAGKDIHSYKYPNNPDNNEWYNLALEDIGMFWDLPNYHEASYYYFQTVDFEDAENHSVTLSPTKDELIEDHYEWRWNEGTHNGLEKTFGAAALGLFGLAVLSL